MSKNHSVELKIAAQSWYEETRSAYLYRIVAQYEKNPSYQKLFHGLAEEAEKQLAEIEKLLEENDLEAIKKLSNGLFIGHLYDEFPPSRIKK